MFLHFWVKKKNVDTFLQKKILSLFLSFSTFVFSIYLSIYLYIYLTFPPKSLFMFFTVTLPFYSLLESLIRCP